MSDNSAREIKNSKCKVAARRTFIAEGWAALHRAALDAGAEVDYWPPDYPELKNRSYIDGEQYAGLLAPLIELAGIDTLTLGERSTAVKKAVWRWLRGSAKANAPALWKDLGSIKSRVALMAAFAGFKVGRRLAGSPGFSNRDPVTVVRFGFWLVTEGDIRGEHPIVPILWGLAIIGAAWGEHLRCGYCKLCFRRSRPGEPFCDSHTQGGTSPENPSAAYMRYRRGRLARALAESRGIETDLWDDKVAKYSNERLVLPKVLFPMSPVDGWDSERQWLVFGLERAPRVVKQAKLTRYRGMAYEELVAHLRMHIDPNEWGDEIWGLIVLKAETWLALEEEVAPGKRGRGRRTSQLVQEAIRLADEGAGNGEIAVRLGVSAPAVSRWKERYPEFAAVCAARSR